MYNAVLHLHSYWAYLVVLMIFIATINSLIGLIGKRPFIARDFRISLFTLIVSHLQIVIGFVLFFVSPKVQWFNSTIDTGVIMKNDQLRLYNLEHPLMMIIAIVLVTIGYSKHKKKLPSKSKFKTLFIFNAIALILVLAMIPWKAWF